MLFALKYELLIGGSKVVSLKLVSELIKVTLWFFAFVPIPEFLSKTKNIIK